MVISGAFIGIELVTLKVTEAALRSFERKKNTNRHEIVGFTIFSGRKRKCMYFRKEGKVHVFWEGRESAFMRLGPSQYLSFASYRKLFAGLSTVFPNKWIKFIDYKVFGFIVSPEDECKRDSVDCNKIPALHGAFQTSNSDLHLWNLRLCYWSYKFISFICWLGNLYQMLFIQSNWSSSISIHQSNRIKSFKLVVPIVFHAHEWCSLSSTIFVHHVR